ncbi:hypothetical protein GD416_24515 [Burkholderia sp. BE24]|uniref:hypothetical protein n=1 Tax=unclassified Burkholderia TaxID=2613784 RepID=UPI00117F22BF|nr:MULTISPECIES: hypothetical protein [unclassified Burkholderia]MPV59494.1 hypothetical protein [Burkholderia sp. BE24]
MVKTSADCRSDTGWIGRKSIGADSRRQVIVGNMYASDGGFRRMRCWTCFAGKRGADVGGDWRPDGGTVGVRVARCRCGDAL